MSKKIIVTIDKMGNSKVEADGFNGVGCEAATGPIEQALAGGTGVERTYKDEWHNNEGQHQEQTVGW